MKSDLVARMDFSIDLSRLQTEVRDLVHRVGWTKSIAQIGLTHRPGVTGSDRYRDCIGSLYDFEADRFLAHERDYCIFNDELRGGYLHWIFENLPFKPARARIMGLFPKRCLTVHEDTGPRYHFAVFTNPGAYLVFPDDSVVFHLPADGHLYRMDALKRHTVINADPLQERIHLVFSDFELC